MRADLPHLLLSAGCGALLLSVAGNASSLPGSRFVGRYDFGYAIRGDRSARPAQVFDDGGGKVFFEARPGQAMPAVFAGGDLALLVLQPEGQYFTARTTASEFTLVLGAARARVRRGASGLGEEAMTSADESPRLLASADPGLVAGVDYGAAPAHGPVHEQPVVFALGSATLRPDVQDALSALVVRIGHVATVTAVGRDDAGSRGPLARRRAESLRNALLARGVAAGRLHLAGVDDEPDPVEAHVSALRWREDASPGDADAAAGHWQVLAQDITLSHTLERWGAQAGYRVKWDAQRDFLVGAPDRIAGSFETALKTVLDSAGIRRSDYPLEACLYANTPPLVRITRRGEQDAECEAP